MEKTNIRIIRSYKKQEERKKSINVFRKNVAEKIRKNEVHAIGSMEYAKQRIIK